MKLSIKELEMIHDSCCTEAEIRKEAPGELSGSYEEYDHLRHRITVEMNRLKAETTIDVNSQSDVYICSDCRSPR